MRSSRVAPTTSALIGTLSAIGNHHTTCSIEPPLRKRRLSERISPGKAHVAGWDSPFALHRHNRPIGAHCHSGVVEFSYLGEDLDEAFG